MSWKDPLLREGWLNGFLMRKSRERGRAIIAGLLTSNDLESQSQQKGIPVRFSLRLTDSSPSAAELFRPLNSHF